VRLVVLHTAEGARTNQALGNYFANPVAQASSHVGIDDVGIEQYVPYEMAAWTIRSANPISDNAELCGFAAWTRAQWLNEHHRMLELAADWVRERCLARDIPIRKLTPEQVGNGEAGVCGHVDWTLGTGDGTHTDPGQAFPWDVVIALACGEDPDGTTDRNQQGHHHLEDDMIYIKCELDGPGKGNIGTAILTGPMFVGLSPDEAKSADANIAKGLVAEQWVTRGTWDEFDRRSHALCDNPRPVSVTSCPGASK
jgi:hypothetical protein